MQVITATNPKFQESNAYGRSANTVSTKSQRLSLGDLKDLRRVVDDIPLRLWAVAVIGFWERFTFWGLTAPWQNYMENARHFRNGAPGALGLGQSMATRIYCAFYLFYYITPLFFAWVSDARLGHFKTLSISIIFYVLGCGALAISSMDFSLDAGFGLPGLIIAMVLVGLGGGGFKMIMVPFIADQYTVERPRLKILKTGERVVTDRSLTLQYIYNMYYWIGNVGSLSWFATTFLEQRYSFTVAYSITFASMVVAMMIFCIGAKWYIKHPPKGNVLSTATVVLLCASKNGFKMYRTDPEYQLEHCGKKVPWTSPFVVELGRGLRACRVLIAFVMFYVCFDQMQNNLISQAGQMETHAIPNDAMPAMNQVACIVLGPVIQYFLYPLLNRHKIDFKPIARITVGFVFIAMSMLYATVVQHAIYSAPPCFKLPGQCKALDGDVLPNRVNVWIQAPVYILLAVGEIFAFVTALEYVYDHSPQNMKAIVQAIGLVIAGIGSACAMALTPVAHDPHLLMLYASLTAAMAVTTGFFWCAFRHYDRMHIDDDSHLIVDVESSSEKNSALPHKRAAGVLRLIPRKSNGSPTDIGSNGVRSTAIKSAQTNGNYTSNGSALNNNFTGQKEQKLKASSGNISLDPLMGLSATIHVLDVPPATLPNSPIALDS